MSVQRSLNKQAGDSKIKGGVNAWYLSHFRRCCHFFKKFRASEAWSTATLIKLWATKRAKWRLSRCCVDKKFQRRAEEWNVALGNTQIVYSLHRKLVFKLNLWMSTVKNLDGMEKISVIECRVDKKLELYASGKLTKARTRAFEGRFADNRKFLGQKTRME